VTKLRRWHFDLAFFVGLLVFGLSYWHIAPEPLWVSRIPTDPTFNMSAGSLGFSSDGQFYYTLKDATIVGNHLPKPMIERWNVKTGELLDEYPLQMPAEDVAYLKPRPRGEEHFCLQTAVLPDQNVIYTTQSTNSGRHEQTYRLYDLTSGECITKQTSLILPTHLWYVIKNPQDGHHWGCYAKTAEPDEPVQFVDLTSGKTLHTLLPDKNMRVQYISWSEAQQAVMILWSGPLKEQKTVMPILGSYRLGTWECIQKTTLPLQPYGIFQMHCMTPDLLEIKYLPTLGKDQAIATIRFRMNRTTNLFEQDGESTLTLYQGEMSRMKFPKDTVLVEQKMLNNTRPLTEPLLTLNNFLMWFGITLWRSRNDLECYVYDLKNGALLRQITGISEFTYSPLNVNSTGHYLAGVKSSEGSNWTTSHSLYMYEIPHHLWERTLRWIMYLSWVLILPWPLRYLIRPAEQAVRTSP
jgi:hypothetical protein